MYFIISYFILLILNYSINNITNVNLIIPKVKSLIEKCDSFLAEYLPGHPSSNLLDIMYSYNMTYVNMYLQKIKSDFNIIFIETIEKYVFLKLSPNDLHAFLKQRAFHSSNEYYFVKGILLWLTYDLDSRFDNARSLFSLINCRLCNKNIMLDNKLINTGNCKLDLIIQQLHINISVLNDKSTLELLNYYKLNSIDSFSIPSYEESTTNTNKKLSLYKVENDGIYDINNNSRIFQYNFGDGNIVIYINSNLLIINFTVGKMLRFNTITNDVTHCSYPHDYLFSGSAPTVNVTIDGDLITIGGQSNNVRLCKVNIYNINTDSWSAGKSLPYGVDSHATVVVDEDIYVIGGDTGGCYINKVIHYRGGEWNTLAPVLHARCRHAALVRDSCIYVYGGNGYGGVLKPECYNITTNVWTSLNTDIFNDVRLYNSVYDESVIYMYSKNNIYSICLDNNDRALLYSDVNISAYCLILMNL